MERDRAYRFVFTLGLVSLLSDVVYEGARSVLGPYLALLGAGGVAVGFVAGMGELFGYSLRLLFGYLADRARAYWALTILGYALTLLSVPLLGLVKSWQTAVVLVLTERLGKAVRAPARDALLSLATKRLGYGKGFGIHELMDQMGAVLGPLLVSLVLFLSSDYRLAFLSLILPSILALLLLFKARGRFGDLERRPPEGVSPRSAFYLYLAGSSFLALGFVQFPLIAFHWKVVEVFPDAVIPVVFSVAMLFDALSALLFGVLFDRIGIRALGLGVLLGTPATLLTFSGSFPLVCVGILLWGLSLGVQESIMRSAIARLTHEGERGRAYGLFHFFLGVSIFTGNTLMGYLHTLGVFYLVLYSSLLQILSLPLFLLSHREVQE
ncbi:MFS transporter [Hydrogenivirga sp.]